MKFGGTAKYTPLSGTQSCPNGLMSGLSTVGLLEVGVLDIFRNLDTEAAATRVPLALCAVTSPALFMPELPSVAAPTLAGSV